MTMTNDQNQNQNRPASKQRLFDDIFSAVQSNSLIALQVLLLHLNPEIRFDLLNNWHLERGLTVLQLAVLNYPMTSLKVIEILLENGAGTELPDYKIDLMSNINSSMIKMETPLWISIELGHPVELVHLLLSYKCDIYFRSNGGPFKDDFFDEKSVLTSPTLTEGFNLVHLAVQCGSDLNILQSILDDDRTGTILLNDQNNSLKFTPISILN